jgi:hypothetical protein
MKLTKKELASLKEIVAEIKKIEGVIANLELQKSNAVNHYRAMRESVDSYKEVLQKKYGDVKIDVATGTITKANEETK